MDDFNREFGGESIGESSKHGLADHSATVNLGTGNSATAGSPHTGEAIQGLAGATSLNDSAGGIVHARGTGEGLVIRLDGRVPHSGLKTALDEFLATRKNFLLNNQVILEWIAQEPDAETLRRISADLAQDYSIQVKASRLREQVKVSVVDTNNNDKNSDRAPLANIGAAGFGVRPGQASTGSASEANARKGASSKTKTPSLFDGIEALDLQEGGRFQSGEAVDRSRVAGDGALWDDPDARIIYSSLRSGQKVETEHTLVVCGDVNPGAEIVAGGDIIVLGALRGVAHAGAYDETGGSRFIFALNLQPTQLRIGTVITRGSADSGRTLAEIARADADTIVVEPYQAKNLWGRR